ncbi:2-dehydro-3-deoxygalactonokinase [Parapedobacter pyrenivorans]|uniref:2-dehydro-3-deoxygalactonokinase n=1 Tax=Parapedobacter pyrenivorans TaxID=1305674 RepID=UPI00333E9FC1
MMWTSFLSCDWGSTAFRIKLVSLADNTVIESIETDQGVVAIANKQIPDGRDRQALLLDVLIQAISELERNIGDRLSDVPIIVSGMASSSFGLVELPYVRFPFSIHPNSLIYSKYVNERLQNPILLVSGMANDYDVARGEETQLLGVHRALGIEDYVCLMPGTHAKHIKIRNGKVIDFRTFMTGELFALMGQHSVLREVVTSASHYPFEEHEHAGRAEFLQGIDDSDNYPLMHGLFHVRTNRLFGRMDAVGCSAYLSGVLIGNEIRELMQWQGDDYAPWVLSGRDSLVARYRTATDRIVRGNFQSRQVIEVADCTVQGHCYIYDELIANQ